MSQQDQDTVQNDEQEEGSHLAENWANYATIGGTGGAVAASYLLPSGQISTDAIVFFLRFGWSCWCI